MHECMTTIENESRSMLGLTWINPEALVTDIGLYIHRKYGCIIYAKNDKTAQV